MNQTQRQRGNLMLVLKVGESVDVGQATITLLSWDRGEARVAIEAPRSVHIRRGNLKERRDGLTPSR